MILAVHMERGPGRDAGHFKKILQKLPDDLVVRSMAVDAGYDSEANHQHARQVKNIRTIIPPKIGKPTDKPPKGKYRRKMKLHWDSKSYGQRWQVETVFSMIKRNLTDSLRSKDYWSQLREVFLLAITHNLLIILFLFQRAFLQSIRFIFLSLLWNNIKRDEIKRQYSNRIKYETNPKYEFDTLDYLL